MRRPALSGSPFAGVVTVSEHSPVQIYYSSHAELKARGICVNSLRRLPEPGSFFANVQSLEKESALTGDDGFHPSTSRMR